MSDDQGWIPEPAQFELDPADSARLKEIMRETSPRPATSWLRRWSPLLLALWLALLTAGFAWTQLQGPLVPPPDGGASPESLVESRLQQLEARLHGRSTASGESGSSTPEAASTTCAGGGEPPARPDPLAERMAAEPSVLFGIDVSSHQGSIDWTEVQHVGVAFAFIRASQGTTFVDPCWSQNWQVAGEAGLRRGAYHVLTATDDGADQAHHFLSVVDPQAVGELPLVADLELSLLAGIPAAEILDELEDWAQAVQASTGRTPMVYASHAFLADLSFSGREKAPVWVAEYSDHRPPESPRGWRPASFWQFSSSGTVPGISGAVDLDRFLGSVAELEAFAPPARDDAAP